MYLLGFNIFIVFQAKDIYNQARINILLIAVICLMMIGNVPVTFTHTEFSEIFFGLKGDDLLNSKRYRIFRAISNNLEQVAFSFNFIIYMSMNRYFKSYMSSMYQRVCNISKTIDELPTRFKRQLSLHRGRNPEENLY